MKILEQYEGIAFLHPMKTAMTSVSLFVRDQMKKNYGSYAVMGAIGHMTPDEIMWRFKYPADVFDKYYCVMFVRNPYDRLVSFYHHMQQIGGHAEGICDRLTFREFALYPRVREVMRPMTDYLYCEGEPVFNFLGRYETLTESVYELIDELGFGNDTEMIKTYWSAWEPRASTKHKPYKEYYDDELKDRVYDQYADDFLTFGYGR